MRSPEQSVPVFTICRVGRPFRPEKRPTVEKRSRVATEFCILQPWLGGERLKIEVKVDAAYGEPMVVVYTDKVTEEIHALVRRLSQDAPEIIVGFRNDEAAVLAEEIILRVYAENGKVFAETTDGRYALRLRLYELEERLDRKRFVRISNSEMVNLGRVSGFDLSLAGTICVRLQNGSVTYVSRRYVAKIKQVLGL